MADKGTTTQHPHYDLKAIKEAVRADRVDWQDSVNDELDKWGYTPGEMFECILALEIEEDFTKTLHYDENNDPRGRGFFDVYVIPWIHYDASGKCIREKVYVKLKYLPNGRAVFLLSFHPSQSGCS